MSPWRKVLVYVFLIALFIFIANSILHVGLIEKDSKETLPQVSIPNFTPPIPPPPPSETAPFQRDPITPSIEYLKSSKSPSNTLAYPNLDNTWILIITWARTEYIEKTINSLLQIPHLGELNLAISQDGQEPFMVRFLDKYNDKFKLFKRVERFHCETKGISSQRIAQNYKCGLRAVFEEFGGEKAIVVEDDMVLSPDFLRYFDRTIPLLDDPTVFCISSWNDFGYAHLVNDPKRFFRTQYFPGLGWALNKKLWLELKPNWPKDLWDEHMRVDSISKNRDCIVPEISRNYNIGVFGANMKQMEYDQILKQIVWNQDASVNYGDLGYLESTTYEENLGKLVASSKRIHSIADIVGIGNVYLMTFNAALREKLLKELSIPLKEMRTQHENTVIVKWQKNVLILANERTSPYLQEPILLAKDSSFTLVPGKRGGSCVETCMGISMKCHQNYFDYIMNCRVLSKYFPCERCGIQFGPDMPNFVQSNGNCLITQAYTPTCEGKHVTTTRLCPCIKM